MNHSSKFFLHGNKAYFSRAAYLKLFIIFLLKLKIFRRFPFDWQTRTGYLSCIFIQINIILATKEIFATVNAMIFGLSHFAVSFVSELDEILRRLEVDIIEVEQESLSPQQIIEMKIRLVEFIIFHGEARKYGHYLHSKTYESAQFIFLTDLLSEFQI